MKLDPTEEQFQVKSIGGDRYKSLPYMSTILVDMYSRCLYHLLLSGCVRHLCGHVRLFSGRVQHSFGHIAKSKR